MEEKKQVLETIQRSAAFKQLEVIRDEIAQLVEDAEAIKTAVAEVAVRSGDQAGVRRQNKLTIIFGDSAAIPPCRNLKLAINGRQADPS